MRGTKDEKPNRSDASDGKPASKPDAQKARQDRLADALRDNLKKRKAQARERAGKKPAPTTDAD